ncbi:MAG: DinB family protein [Dehalococcoidia bacterium]
MNVSVELFRHHRWANDGLFALCEGLDEHQLEATAAGTMGSIRDTLLHIANTERFCISAIRNEPIEPRRTEFPGVAALREQMRHHGDALVELVQSVPDDAVWTGQWAGVTSIPLQSFFTQAINHATDHRSQVMTILAQLGIETPNLDGWAFHRSQLERP